MLTCLNLVVCACIVDSYFYYLLFTNHIHNCVYSTTVISQPDDVTICEGRGAVFTCVLNSNITSDDVQWYRFIKDTSTTEMVDPNGENIKFITHTNASSSTVNNGSATPISNGNIIRNTSLTITNAIKSYTGYFWVETPSINVCNVSLTVATSTYVSKSLTYKIIKH